MMKKLKIENFRKSQTTKTLLIKENRTTEDKQFSCYICITARYVDHQAFVKGRGYKRSLTSYH